LVLNEAKNVVLDSNGNGTVQIGPAKANERWRVRTVAVSTSTAVKVPTASVYTGYLAPGNLIGGTYTGSNDSTDVDVELGPGSFLTVQWTGGDAGARATVSIYGDRLVRSW